MKTLLPVLIACLALSACVETGDAPATTTQPPVEKKEPWIETHDHSDSAWMMSSCDLFPNLYGKTTLPGGTTVCNGGATPTKRIVGYGGQ